MASGNTRNRMHELDSLRGLAALSVVWSADLLFRVVEAPSMRLGRWINPRLVDRASP